MISWIAFILVTLVAIRLAYGYGLRNGYQRATELLIRQQEREYERIMEDLVDRGQRLGRPLTIGEVAEVFIGGDYGVTRKKKGPNS